jgi:hypothetical protein
MQQEAKVSEQFHFLDERGRYRNHARRAAEDSGRRNGPVFYTPYAPKLRGSEKIKCERDESGAKGARTPDLLHAMQALSQLSYSPMKFN